MPDCQVSSNSVSPKTAMPSPKYCESSFCICSTSPFSSRTLRIVERPFRPVPS